MKTQIPLPQPIKFTQEGYKKLEEDHKNFLSRRKEAVIKLKTAREGGDLSENGAYKAARFELSFVDREIRRITYLLRFGEIHKSTEKNIIDFGHKVTVWNGKKEQMFTLVNEFEASPKEEKISIKSPLGKALIGKKPGDVVVITTPAGEAKYSVVTVQR